MKDGGPAFPQPNVKVYRDGETLGSAGPIEYGMSLRDWFAGMAMQSMIRDVPADDPEGMKMMAEEAYQAADAMLAEREKSNG